MGDVVPAFSIQQFEFVAYLLLHSMCVIPDPMVRSVKVGLGYFGFSKKSSKYSKAITVRLWRCIKYCGGCSTFIARMQWFPGKAVCLDRVQMPSCSILWSFKSYPVNRATRWPRILQIYVVAYCCKHNWMTLITINMSTVATTLADLYGKEASSYNEWVTEKINRLNVEQLPSSSIIIITRWVQSEMCAGQCSSFEIMSWCAETTTMMH